MLSLEGKTGLIVGVANKRSICWAIAQAVRRGRAARGHLPGRAARRERPRAGARADSPPILPLRRHERRPDRASCSRRSTRSSAASTSSSMARRSRPAKSSPRRSSQTSREGFRMALDVSAYSLIALARGAAPLMAPRGGGSILTLTYLGSERVFHELQRDGRRQGGARGVRPLPRVGSRPAEHPRQRHLGRARSRRSPRRASPDSRASCRSTASARRSGAPSTPQTSPAPRSSCWRCRRASPARSSWWIRASHIMGL